MDRAFKIGKSKNQAREGMGQDGQGALGHY